MPAYMNAYAEAGGTDRTAVQGTTALDAAGTDRTAAGAESGTPADTAAQDNNGKAETAPGSGDKAAAAEDKTARQGIPAGLFDAGSICAP